jgi:glycosyltransferase involved in cell wall biosynthesis
VDDNELLLVTVGRLVEQKGHEYLLQALSRLGPAAPGGRPLRLAIVGDGPLRTSLPRRAEELGLGRQVIFAGFRADVEDVMAAADLYVHPSLWEGFGLVLLEAMAMGLPVITTTHTAGPDLIHDGVEGFIVPIRDSEAIATRLELLHRDPARLAAMAQQARQRARAFSWNNYETTMAACLQQALTGN